MKSVSLLLVDVTLESRYVDAAHKRRMAKALLVRDSHTQLYRSGVYNYHLQAAASVV